MTWLPTAILLIASVIAVGGITAWQVWSTGVLSLLAWVCIGLAFGVSLRPVISVPLAILAAFGWFAFTPSIDPPWIRNLSGRWNNCCEMASVPGSLVMVGIIMMAGVFVVASLIVIQAVDSAGRWRPARHALAWVVLVGGFAAAGAVTHTTGYSQSQPRSDQPLCVSGTPKLCFWPERAGYLSEAETQVRTWLDRWQSIGVDLADTMSETAVSSPTDDVARLSYAHIATSENRINWLAEGVASWCSPDAAETSEGLGFFQVKDWLLHQVEVDQMISDPDGLSAVLALPLEDQLRHINAALTRARRCS